MSAPATGPPSRRESGSSCCGRSPRFRSRRFIQVLLALGVLGWLVAVGIALHPVRQPRADGSPGPSSRPRQDCSPSSEQYRQQCLDADRHRRGQLARGLLRPGADRGGLTARLVPRPVAVRLGRRRRHRAPWAWPA